MGAQSIFGAIAAVGGVLLLVNMARTEAGKEQLS